MSKRKPATHKIDVQSLHLQVEVGKHIKSTISSQKKLIGQTVAVPASHFGRAFDRENRGKVFKHIVCGYDTKKNLWLCVHEDIELDETP